MRTITSLFITLVLLCSTQDVFAQKKSKKTPLKNDLPKIISCGVCNQEAVLLPKPEYPKSARFIRASGSVNVEILINENGSVESARAVSGHPLLHPASIKAALQAKFKPFLLSGKPVKVRGTIVYNFNLDAPDQPQPNENIKTIRLGVLNDKAKVLPLPKLPKAYARVAGIVDVQVKIDLQKGEVVSASTISGHPLLRMSAEIAARQAKFEPVLTEFPTIYGTGILTYKVEDFTGKTIENENPSVLLRFVPGGIVNGKAINLEQLEYPKEAKDFCANGKAEVTVLINGASGEVLAAKAVSGNELSWQSAEKSAMKTKFSLSNVNGSKDFYVIGKIVYNFTSNHKCISNGIVNMRALRLPKPPFSSTFNGKIKELEIVVVQIIVDESGDVIYARSISGIPLFKQASEVAARQTKFAPTLVDGGSPFKVNALLVYKFKSDGTVDTKIERDDKDVVGLPINLVEPPPPFCNCRFGGNSSVIVQVEIDEQGNVVKATAITGHPILKLSSEKAALESKFIPANIKTKKYIRYNFEATSKYSVKISSVEIMEIKTNK